MPSRPAPGKDSHAGPDLALALPCHLRNKVPRFGGGELHGMSRLRIYGVARTRAFRAIWMAKELGLDYEHVPIEIGPAGARKPEYLAINPNGRLPAIEDDGFVLWESQAITLYLAKKHSLGRLYPGTLEGEAKAWQWSLWAANEVERAVNRLLQNLGGPLPLALLSQYLPLEYTAIRDGRLENSATAIIRHHIQSVVKSYAAASGASPRK